MGGLFEVFMRSALRERSLVNFSGAVLLSVIACNSKDGDAQAVVATHAADGATPTRHLEDASSPTDIGARSKRDAGPSIDCVKAGKGERRDSSFLPGIFTAHVDLPSYCATFDCPYETLRDFLNAYSCSPIDAGGYTPDQARRVGCGLETIGGIGLFGGTEYVFDGATGELVGAQIGDDTPFGPCNTALYVAGRANEPCSGETLYDCRAVP